MNPTKYIINEILAPKKDKFIAELIDIVDDHKEIITRTAPWTTYYEVWHYHNFNFNYVFLAAENYVLDISSEKDIEIFKQIISLDDNKGLEINDAYNKYRMLEFDFISNCWEYMQEKCNLKERCFWVEYGNFRTYDVNNRIEMDENEHREILKAEGLTQFN